MSLNVELLQRVKQHILEEPARLRMEVWAVQGEPGTTKYTTTPGYNEPNEYKFPACGTVACIAGWTALLNNPQADLDSSEVRSEYAETLLGIKSTYIPFDLFYVDHWPLELMNAYIQTKASDIEGRAQIVGRVIDRYIDEYLEKQALYDAR